jgi:hypothetical protein
MKKKRIIPLAVIVLISGVFISLVITNHTPSDRIKFGYMECIKLDSGEYRVDPIDSVSIHEFMRNCQYDKLEIYLNRVLRGKNKTFIALSTRMAPQEYIAQMNIDSLLTVFSSKQYSNNYKLYYAFFIKKKDTFTYRTLYSEPKHGNMILLDIMNKDSLSMLKLYNNPNYLVNRLNCEK